MGIIQLFLYSLLTTSLFIFLCKPNLVDAGLCFGKTKKRWGVLIFSGNSKF